MRFLRGVIGAILLVLLAVFAVANRQTVTINTAAAGGNAALLSGEE